MSAEAPREGELEVLLGDLHAEGKSDLVALSEHGLCTDGDDWSAIACQTNHGGGVHVRSRARP